MDVADLKSIHDAKRSKKESNFPYALDAVDVDDRERQDSWKSLLLKMLKILDYKLRLS